MTSQKIDVVSAPMSFAGSLARTQNWLWFDKPVWYKWSLGWLAVSMVVMIWWMFILMWYMIFGLLLAPYRLRRRGSRKRKLQARQHQELLEAVRKENK